MTPAGPTLSDPAPAPELTVVTPLGLPGVEGYLVVDRRVRGTAWGGLCVLPDVTLEEITASARCMTIKYGFLGLCSGGAKAALRLPPEHEPVRRRLLAELGARWSGHLRDGWNPGLDMGCSLDDLRALLLGAGQPRRAARGSDTSGVYTGWTVYFAALAALAHRGRGPKGATYVVQGFGRVGTEFARRMHAAGARLVGVSTRAGALADLDGLDLHALLELRRAFGDDWVLHAPPARRVQPEDLLQLSANVLVPAARCWALHAANRDAVRAGAVVCAANVAMDPETEVALGERGVAVVPDFVANCGGVLGTTLEGHLGPAHIFALLEGGYRRKVERLLRAAADSGVPLRALASREAETSLDRLAERGRPPAFHAARWVLARLPRFAREPLGYARARSMFFPEPGD
ncbi:MAG: Glu/Leu/Phe/Val dehydrogenase [Candidatus Eisenbacteria bacterium]|nr:Glu/Leu/Phe/Val dehydrogenase [Candidatus Eisenbacteria bacterium]